jgi:phytanoyl-CoA hydroxylase
MTQLSADFHQKGFVILPDFLSKNEIDKIQSDIKQIFITALSHAGLDNVSLTRNSSFEDVYSKVMNTDPDLKSRAYDLLGKLNSVLQVFGKPSLTELTSNINDAPILLNSVQVRLDDNNNTFVLPWHQETNQISLLTVNLWVPLSDLEENMGGLEVCPGSHKSGLQSHIDKSDGYGFDRLPEALVNSFETLRIQPKAGDALVFHPFLYHRSLPNSSSKTRLTIAGRLNEIETSAYFRSKDAPLLIPRNPDIEKFYYKFIKNFMSKDR